MDQLTLVESIGNHLDTAQSYVNAITLLAVAAAWAGIRRSREIETLGTKFDRRQAFWALSALYLIANMAVLVLFLRIGDLVGLLDSKHAVTGITKLATHSWILNPFSYFGSGSLPRFYSSEGLGLLIATWWLCNASLSTLMDDKRNRCAAVLLGLFLLLGVGSMLAIQRTNSIALSSLRAADPDLYAKVSVAVEARWVGSLLGTVVGGLIFLAANRLQARAIHVIASVG